MKITQNWVGYIDRSYQQIKQSVLNRLVVNNPEITDFSESNPLILLISIFAAIGEMLNLYIDAVGRECFLGTMRKYTSALRLVKLTDYRVKAVIAPTVDLSFTLMVSGTPTPYPSGAIVIPNNVEVDSILTSVPFLTQAEVTFRPGDTVVSVGAKSYSTRTSIDIGTSDGSINQAFLLQSDYVHGSLTCTIGGDTWQQYGSFGYMQAGTKGFIVDILDDGNPYAVFGDGLNGAIPAAAEVIYGTYQTSVGQLGNLPSNSITKLITSISLPTGYSLVVTNPDYSSGGSDIEGLSQIRDRAPRDLRTLNRAVTPTDYEDLAVLSPGVGLSAVSYCCCCGTQIDLYIAPSSRGIATSVLLSDTALYFRSRKIIGRKLNLLPAGVSRVWLDIGAVAANGVTVFDATTAIILSLDTNFGYNGSDINRQLQPADFANILKALPQLSDVSINRMFLEPYARPQEHNIPLQITFTPTVNTTPALYKVEYDYNSGSPRFILYKNTVFYAFINIATPYSDGTLIGFTIYNSGAYVDGMTWAFKIHPSYPEAFLNYSLDVDDYSVPVVDVDFSNLIGGLPTIFSNITVTTSTTNSACKTNC